MVPADRVARMRGFLPQEAEPYLLRAHKLKAEPRRAAALALMARDQCRRQRAAADVGRQRQRGHPAERRELQSDQPVDGDEGDVVGEEQTLAQRQQQQIAVQTGSSAIQASAARGAVSARSTREPSVNGR